MYSHLYTLLVTIYMKYLFLPFTFSLCVSLNLKWVSCRQYIVGSYFFVFLSIFCLLIGNSIHLQLIIDREEFIIAIWLFPISLVLVYFYVLFCVWVYIHTRGYICLYDSLYIHIFLHICLYLYIASVCFLFFYCVTTMGILCACMGGYLGAYIKYFIAITVYFLKKRSYF